MFLHTHYLPVYLRTLAVSCRVTCVSSTDAGKEQQMATAQPMRLAVEVGTVNAHDDEQALEALVGSVFAQQADRYAKQVDTLPA